jgi:cytochrome P450
MEKDLVTSYSETGKIPVPEHVPAGRVTDFDYFNPPGLQESGDVFLSLKSLHGGPDIQWTPRNGGHWILTRAADIRWSRSEPIVFSRAESVLPAGSMNTLMPPTNVDPPYHARFRAVLNPYFTPGAIKRRESEVRALTAELIDGLKPQGRCEFVEEFGRIMPVIVFLNLLELPVERRSEFLEWGRAYINASDQAVKDQAAATVAGFLREVLEERRSHPRDDLFSNIAKWRDNPRYQSDEEIIGMAMVSFLAGLDTVTGILSFTMLHLATHPQARRRLIEEPGILPNAVEEFFRRHGLANSGRIITEDIERDGITMKRGDLVLVPDALASMDERAYSDPMTIDFDRDTRTHDTFGGGVHRCIGEHLARLEMTVFLEEWMKRIPEFRIDPDRPPKTYSGVVMGVSQLGLLWD